ncbi:hypothetical protein JB92DRAFT_2938450 [Gautieria morchelliformis]|nr:hypothetical protein JB92DRAFT_2938450 [Gautieria morchelliformis]
MYLSSTPDGAAEPLPLAISKPIHYLFVDELDFVVFPHLIQHFLLLSRHLLCRNRLRIPCTCARASVRVI